MNASTTLALLAASVAFSQPPPADPRTLLQSAIADEKAGRVDAAVRRLNTLLSGAPGPEMAGQARLELVRIHERRGDWWEAAGQLQQLRQLAPGDPEYAYQLGVVYRNLSKAAFEHMQTVAPQSARVEQMFGEQYAVAGDTRKAIAAYERAIAADPKLPGSHLALAMIHLREQKRDRALVEIDKELAIVPASVLAAQLRQAIVEAGR